ncbi:MULTISPECIES: sensor histidine kinase [Citromicrobium]|uniref:sensor histidine kinase n=1 Tax=Citromicrobium TaxID=72173 RepID=UPI0001DD0C8A|nr:MULTISPECIES: CHASE3 domain-containing protein [Citromicrobium]ALG59640.1 histidine kinase [Citromicrobium sp. JL477]KPM17253.1 histidine kinase [Citromicrobium sp. JL1351]KPM20190.1 histidine kinase [Citromicrobium sp. JL31]KPM29265.1 histidine kinase [Citromicrobium sp. JL2201]
MFIRRWFNWLVLGAMAGAILGAVLLLLSTGAAERAERNQVERLGDVLLMLDRIERAALSAESAQRGYYITLDTRYLKPYRTSRRDAETAMERLARSINTRMTDEQRAEFVAIEDALNDKFAELDQTIGQVERGQLRDARRQILEGEGYDAMQRLTAAIDRLAQIENRLLDEQSARAQAAEARILPLLGLLLLLLVSAIVLGAVLVARTAQAETEAAQARELEVARDRANLLAQELNHRVKNLFAMVLAIIQMSAREASDVTAYKDRISARIHALLTAHEVTQGHGTAADRLNRQGGASLRALVEATVEPHVSQDKRLVLEGDDVAIDRVQVTPLGLVLHELATNAVKYGCWRDAGELTVRWTRKGNLLHLDWQEDWDTADQQEGEQPAQSQGGFGSTLMIGAARQMGGEIERTFGPRGVTVSIAFPAQPGKAAA